VKPLDPALLEDYDHFPRIEEAFGRALDESLNPRGPDSLYDIVEPLALVRGAKALDLGCGEGKQSIELARRFGFAVIGVDPVPRHIDLASEAAKAAGVDARFELGRAEAIPLADASVDLIWCREVMVLVADLSAAFAECWRVLREGGRMLLYQMFATELMEPREAERLFGRTDSQAPSWDAQKLEDAFARAGFDIDRQIDFGGEWGEFAQERRGDGGRQLVHAARLLRDPERYIAQFGRRNYEIKLGDTTWHVYRMIGKLSGRAYLLKRNRARTSGGPGPAGRPLTLGRNPCQEACAGA
jgi:SAM-dependent methyltransferase